MTDEEAVVLNTENTHSYPILYSALNGNEYIIARTPSFTMISVYKPPHQSLSTVTQDLQNMLHFIPHDSTSRTILLGDLNSDILQLSTDIMVNDGVLAMMYSFPFKAEYKIG
jgi:hypothetical protein